MIHRYAFSFTKAIQWGVKEVFTVEGYLPRTIHVDYVTMNPRCHAVLYMLAVAINGNVYFKPTGEVDCGCFIENQLGLPRLDGYRLRLGLIDSSDLITYTICNTGRTSKTLKDGTVHNFVITHKGTP